MKLGLIYARARNGAIGLHGQLPWHLPEDLAHFKAITTGCPVIMGRKTWDSLPSRFRPLPGRRNLVVTRQAAWQAEGAERAGSVAAAIAIAIAATPASSAPKAGSGPGMAALPTDTAGSVGAPDRAWVIGGAELYALAEPLADVAEVTWIDQDFEGDAFAPTLGPAWREVARTDHRSASGLPYAFVRYERRPGP
jgi:dihydrofolate reductase